MYAQIPKRKSCTTFNFYPVEFTPTSSSENNVFPYKSNMPTLDALASFVHRTYVSRYMQKLRTFCLLRPFICILLNSTIPKAQRPGDIRLSQAAPSILSTECSILDCVRKYQNGWLIAQQY